MYKALMLIATIVAAAYGAASFHKDDDTNSSTLSSIKKGVLSNGLRNLPVTIEIPILRSLDFVNAKRLLESLGLSHSIVKKISPESIGTVIGQQPRAGVFVQPKSVVELVISAGEPERLIPTSINLDNPFLKYSTWKGSYICQQGKTALTFRVKSAGSRLVNTELGPAYDITAIFDFNFNNRSAAGAFYLLGKYYPEDKVAVFDPGEWVRNPENFISVGMDGLISLNGTGFSGNIVAPSVARCRGFKLVAQTY